MQKVEIVGKVSLNTAEDAISFTISHGDDSAMVSVSLDDLYLMMHRAKGNNSRKCKDGPVTVKLAGLKESQ